MYTVVHKKHLGQLTSFAFANVIIMEKLGGPCIWLYIYTSFCIFPPVWKVPQVIINKQKDESEDGRLGSTTEPLGAGHLLVGTYCVHAEETTRCSRDEPS